jgi:hypothetical protein
MRRLVRIGAIRKEGTSLSEFRRLNSFQVALLPAALAVLTFAGATFAQHHGDTFSEPLPLRAPVTSLKTAQAANQAPSNTPREGHERILGVIPAFEVTNQERPPALTPGEKFGLFARQAFDPFQWVVMGATAGVNQAENTWPGYGQGSTGYAKRYGAVVADATDREFISNFLFPVLLKQDPRYFQLGYGKILRRIAYSLGQECWGKTDQGTRQFNYSKVLGAFAAKAVSNTYYPKGDRGFESTMRNSVVSLLSGMATNLAAEFWPDIKRKVLVKCRNP